MTLKTLDKSSMQVAHKISQLQNIQLREEVIFK